MGERVADEIVIAAEIGTVWEIITDLPRYPEWASGVVATEALSRNELGYPHRGRFVIDARIAEFSYVIQYHYEDRQVSWHLVEGDTVTQLDGRYELSPATGGTRVRFALEVDVDMPLPGFMKQRAARTILDQGLAGLKTRAEAVSRDAT